MRAVTFKVKSKPQSFEFGTVGGKWLFIYGEQGSGAAIDKINTVEQEVTVNLEDGDYWVLVTRLDSEGDQLGGSARAEFSVTPDSVMIDVADGVAVSFGVPA